MPNPLLFHHRHRRLLLLSHFLLLQLLLLIFLQPPTVTPREADDRPSFLYIDDLSLPVREYQVHTAPSGDYEEENEAHLFRQGPEEERHIKPYFLKDDYDAPRVVEFYSPWCGHCQKFKRRYVEVAQEVMIRNIDRQQMEVEFHAISCSAYHWVCKDNNVTSYPTIRAYRPNTAHGTTLERFNPDVIATAVGVILEAAANAAIPNPHQDDGSSQLISTSHHHQNRPPPGAVDILGASTYIHHRVRRETYADAALSLIVTLRTSIYYPDSPQTPLPPQRRQAFSEWIDLLYWTLPPTWLLHTLVNDLRQSMEEVLGDKEELIRLVDAHATVVLQHSSSTYSPGCHYACGIWNLLHIISLGVAERHGAVLGDRHRVNVKHAWNAMDGFIRQFFDCEVCRETWGEMYEECGRKKTGQCWAFDTPKVGLEPGVDGVEEMWRDLALWLWEMHNVIDERVRKVKRERDKKEEGGDWEEGEDGVLWPEKKECERCWMEDGTWDRFEVFAFLKKEYWPGGVQNFRYVVLERKSNTEETTSFFENILPRIILGMITMFGLGSFMKRWNVRQTGRHKKIDRIDRKGVLRY